MEEAKGREKTYDAEKTEEQRQGEGAWLEEGAEHPPNLRRQLGRLGVTIQLLCGTNGTFTGCVCGLQSV